MQPLICPCILPLPPKPASMPKAVLFLLFVLCSVWLLFGLFVCLVIYLFVLNLVICLRVCLFIFLFFFFFKVWHPIQVSRPSFPEQGGNLSPRVASTESCPHGMLIGANPPGRPYHSANTWFPTPTLPASSNSGCLRSHNQQDRNTESPISSQASRVALISDTPIQLPKVNLPIRVTKLKSVHGEQETFLPSRKPT